MRVRILFFARAREIAGTESVELALDAGGRLADVVAAVSRRFPDLGDYLRSCRFAIDREFSDLGAAVPDGAEVAVIPPVSGG